MEIQRSNAASIQRNQQAEEQLRQSREESRTQQTREESRALEPASSKAPKGNQQVEQVEQAPEIAKGTTATQGNRINTFA